MVYYRVPQEEIDKLVPYVKDGIEKGLEFLVLDQMNIRCNSGILNKKIYDYTMDSYNNMKKCMPEPIARENGLINGIEYIMEKYLNSTKIKDKLKELGLDE